MLFCLASSAVVCAVLLAVLFFIGKTGLLVFRDVSPAEFFFSLEWLPEQELYGAGIFIIGTLLLTGLTMLIAAPISILLALFVSEIAPQMLRNLLRPVLDLLVGIPSVVYGYLGVTVLIPFLRSITGENLGDGLLASSLVLTLMILPTVSRISDEAISAVPRKYRDAAFALGSTRLQMMVRVLLPAAKNGILSAIILGMARAIGETMAVVMVIGNTAQLASDLFTPTSVLTSNIVMQISNVQFESTWNYALYMMAFLLLAISLLLIILIRAIRPSGGHAS